MASHGSERMFNTAESSRPCRACMDFKSWAKQQKSAFSKDPSSEKKGHSPDRKDCPLDKDELGNQTWGFLHTMTAYYPDKPTPKQKSEMSTFFTIFSNFYPCEVCAEDLRQQLKVTPPVTDSQHALSQWLCRIHNNINRRLGKSEFDCSRVNERWRDGWLDGSCD